MYMRSHSNSDALSLDIRLMLFPLYTTHITASSLRIWKCFKLHIFEVNALLELTIRYGH